MKLIKYAVIFAVVGLAGCVVPVQNGQTPVCHKGKTIYVGDPAVDAHLKHGDYVGVCR